MPPGTGDVAISVGQILPHADVLVVTTPQSAASDVAIRSGLVARQTGQHLIGVIENMSPVTMPNGDVWDLFGSGGGGEVAKALSTEEETVPLLGSVPLSPGLRRGGDSGNLSGRATRTIRLPQNSIALRAFSRGNRADSPAVTCR